MADVSARIELAIKESVTEGGPFLNRHYSGWRNRIDPSAVMMTSIFKCMLAQASGKSYSEAAADHDWDYAARAKLRWTPQGARSQLHTSA